MLKHCDQKQSEKERVYSILQLVVYHPGKPRQELTAVLTAHLKVCFALTVPVSLQSFKKACDDASPKGNRSYQQEPLFLQLLNHWGRNRGKSNMNETLEIDMSIK